MIEAEVHHLLHTYLRIQGTGKWPHHLTMARLIARALRLGRSALIQTGIPAWTMDPPYRFSYLISVMAWSDPAIIVVPESVLSEIVDHHLPHLCHPETGIHPQLCQTKPIQVGDCWPDSNYSGVLLTTPMAWLGDRLQQGCNFPANIPTIIDGVDDLESWTRQQLSIRLYPSDWEKLIYNQPQLTEPLRNARVKLTQRLFQHPANPYDCHLLEAPERKILTQLQQFLQSYPHLPPKWQQFWSQWESADQLYWAEVERSTGTFTLSCGPVDVAPALSSIWSQQPVVLIGESLDLEKEAVTYRQRLGLGDLTCVKFSRDRSSMIQLYLPSGLPMPNTPRFQACLMEQLRRLLLMSWDITGLKVLLIGDVPLKAQVGAILASEFGSQVQVESTHLEPNGILVTGWEFWQQHQSQVPAPHILAIATLPLPSLEHPLVAGRVAYHKQNRQDWFQLYLLPTALNQLQRAVAPVRSVQGIVALFDNRVLHRSYGQQVLTALSPLARINYLDRTGLIDEL